MAALSATLKSARQVMVVDRHLDRLQLAEKIGAIPIDDSKGSPVDQVLKLTGGKGADKGYECVGYQCHDLQGHEHSAMTMNNLVRPVKFTGEIGVVGIFLPQDPKAPGELEKKGEIAFDMGWFWFKGQRIGTGQANVKHYNRQLRDLITAGKAKPSWIVSHNCLSLKRQMLTSTSMPETMAGPRSCSGLRHELMIFNGRRCEMSLTRRVGAEFIGTFWLVFVGCGSAVLAAGFSRLGIGFIGVGLAFGLTLLTMAYAIGRISGCHINPAALDCGPAGGCPAAILCRT
jgi:hypothetical protein